MLVLSALIRGSTSKSFLQIQNNVSIRAISSSQLQIHKTTDKSRFESRPKQEDLQFGKTLSDHMLMIEWDKENQWKDPKIVPYQNLTISPAASCINYGLTCFEGMKAYKALSDQSLRLFRPDCNMERLKNSMERLSMPGYDFDSQELINCIKELVKLDRDWVPHGEGYSLYLRPNVIAMHQYLGLAAPDSLLLYVCTSPVGPYYKTGFKPIRLTCENTYVRAWPGGTGNAKVGGNYAPTMKPAAEAAERGYSQVLWVFGENDEITEVGAMNVFFVLIDKNGKKQIITPPLDRGDILPGVTRRSIIDLARTWQEFEVSERNITMEEVCDASKEGRLLEAFGAGTAAVVTPINCIEYKGNEIDIPATGKVTQRVWDELTDIQYGKIDHPWSVKVET
mmetsp:Transcript_30321/g.34889  ORF Transcript_30321/g.34889 Transcript_30321/m.34889 type:complete len:394 (+) Transcript_30321:212-1393(+)